ncbi:MAG: hypothetical protein Q4G61_00755 [Tissierellia bacterium]|nr:hypothetical protein [Tissierellia bacterium]
MDQKNRKKNHRRQSQSSSAIKFLIVSLLLLSAITAGAIGLRYLEKDKEQYVSKLELAKIQEEKQRQEEESRRIEAEQQKNAEEKAKAEAEAASEVAESEAAEKNPYDIQLSSVAGPLNYYNQGDDRWAQLLYGPSDPIVTHGCGPAVMATIVDSLTEQDYDPYTMGQWAYENGYCAVGNGSAHSLISGAAQAFGLTVEPLYYPTPQQLVDTLNSGKLVVQLAGHGIFSPDDGHFIILREVTQDGKIRISDSVVFEHLSMEWTPEELLAEASPVSSAGGPFWAIGK